MAQDFWASSGFRLLHRGEAGLVASEAWLARFLERDELRLPEEAGSCERELHGRIASDPGAEIPAAMLEAVEDDDARDNWREFLRFRDRVLGMPSLEAVYLDLYSRPGVDLAPPFVDALTQAITRSILDGSDDAWLCRAGEMMFRRQRVAVEGGQALAADSATVEAYAETGGFGNVGRLLRQQDCLPAVKMDVLSHENAPLYFLRDELHSFALDLTPGREGARALARVLSRWVRHLVGAEVTIEPVERVEDGAWRWHVGLDVDATAILNSLYRGEEVAPAELERMVLLFRLEFADAGDAVPEMAGRPVYLGLACRPDRTLRMKPQNLVTSLPLAAAH
ncbi:MAG TPA: DUF6352 family protein [Usitatibacter sp.]